MIRLATDVGGTFTDLVGYDERTGEVYTAKGLTTTDDQSRGVMDTIETAQTRDGLRPDEVTFLAHGGTTVINAITERTGVKTALVTTRGFRDVLEIGRGNRPDLYNLRTRSPEVFVPRELRFEIDERMDAAGTVLRAPDMDGIAPVVEACRAAGVEAIGVVFLHSYINPAHERQVADALAAAMPDVTVCASHEISRQWREFERSSTVALNAYVQPILRRYFGRLEAALQDRQIACPYYAMQSNGGISTFDQAMDSPLTLVESGPSGGVAGAVRIGDHLGEENVLYLDVGGTTAKCSLITEGRAVLNTTYRLEHTRTWPGYPLQLPVVDIVEIGAGGGSIASLDARGGLRVGPRSAGSDPGPASYGRGGTEPTVTDALLTIGLFDPAAFAGGSFPLDVELARAAIGRLAGPLGVGVEQAALAIIEIAHANMINALKLVTVQRGHDPRDAAFVVSGGAGPALATRLGRDLGVRAIVIPPHPGIFSAWGMLAAEPRVDFRKTWFADLSTDALSRLSDSAEEMRTEALTHFGRGTEAPVSCTFAVEARYAGQEHGVMAPWTPGEDIATFTDAFHTAHERAYTFRLPETGVEITGLHLEARLAGTTITMADMDPAGRGLDDSRTGQRDVWLGDADGWVPCPVHARARLPLNTALPGPMIVEEDTTTTLVLPGQTAEVERAGSLVIREAG
ncbi:hydantoinase/oxoprolinase family protein [Roseivivax sediminis]|uniref:N-methylhydantoinase A n=1 Tax=Roseivivax sediminis TaxID=936889 RepID=A0A1I1V6R2_9RHOB|nr:hydantoinase/oxoprolinase family protein [Roseivivax sediminis]SFD78515.1 N-methylhydantoinase A [Roseivivax sediminis]